MSMGQETALWMCLLLVFLLILFLRFPLFWFFIFPTCSFTPGYVEVLRLLNKKTHNQDPWSTHASVWKWSDWSHSAGHELIGKQYLKIWGARCHMLPSWRSTRRPRLQHQFDTNGPGLMTLKLTSLTILVLKQHDYRPPSHSRTPYHIPLLTVACLCCNSSVPWCAQGHSLTVALWHEPFFHAK